MRSLKNILFTVFLACGTFSLLLSTGCTTEKKEEKRCDKAGIPCKEGEDCKPENCKKDKPAVEEVKKCDKAGKPCKEGGDCKTENCKKDKPAVTEDKKCDKAGKPCDKGEDCKAENCKKDKPKK